MIKILDQNTIDKIAAGEVIERPSSVVKELVENSIDAGATSITVELKDGGKTYIRITDNGCGIEKDEVRLALMRHATSKLSDAEGLSHLTTLGFRGEALSTISAVSQTEMITKTRASLTGVKYVIHGGKELELSETGAPDGTTFIIKNLFFNTPARLKFLKSNMTEGSYINDLVVRLALSHPDISLRLISNGKNVVETSGNGKLREVIYSIYGRDITKNMLEVDYADENIRITGYIGKPFISKGNRGFENYFINGRFIKSNIINRAIEEGYKTFIMQHKFPFTVLNLSLPTEECDVNVHPTKMEFRYNNEKALFHAVYHAVSDALSKKEIIPDMAERYDRPAMASYERSKSKEDSAKANPWTRPSANSPVSENVNKVNNNAPEKGRIESQITSKSQASDRAKSVNNPIHDKGRMSITGTFDILEAMLPKEFREKLSDSRDTSASDKKDTVEVKNDVNLVENDEAIKDEEIQNEVIQNDSILDDNVVKEEASYSANSSDNQDFSQQELFNDIFLSKEAVSHHKIIGQAFDTYWITEFDGALYIMDQHAAHEKVNYEAFLKDFKNKEIISQMIYPAEIISVSNVEKDVILENLQIFQRAGFMIEEFGGNEFRLQGLPFNSYGLSARDIFEEFLSSLLDSVNGSHITEDIFVRKIASMSCKAAIKGNQRISIKEAGQLIEKLLTLDNPYTCPHGRPTLIKLTKEELEKKFRRIV